MFSYEMTQALVADRQSSLRREARTHRLALRRTPAPGLASLDTPSAGTSRRRGGASRLRRAA